MTLSYLHYLKNKIFYFLSFLIFRSNNPLLEDIPLILKILSFLILTFYLPSLIEAFLKSILLFEFNLNSFFYFTLIVLFILRKLRILKMKMSIFFISFFIDLWCRWLYILKSLPVQFYRYFGFIFFNFCWFIVHLRMFHF